MKLEAFEKIIKRSVREVIKEELNSLRSEIVDLIESNNKYKVPKENIRNLNTVEENKIKSEIKEKIFNNQNIDSKLKSILNETLSSMNDEDILSENNTNVNSVIESDNIPGNLSKIFNRDYSQIMKKTEKFSGGSKNFRP